MRENIDDICNIINVGERISSHTIVDMTRIRGSPGRDRTFIKNKKKEGEEKREGGKEKEKEKERAREEKERRSRGAEERWRRR